MFMPLLLLTECAQICFKAFTFKLIISFQRVLSRGSFLFE